MKTKTTIEKLSKNDLTNLFNAILEGIYGVGLAESSELLKNKQAIEEKDDYLEDILAKWLLLDDDNYIIVYDLESDVNYKITLKDVKEGWGKAINKYNWLLSDYSEDEDMEFRNAEIILQTIIFGDVLYW